ncbi:unnamed protein product [Moneuplotes crassus]|uniref:Uncharacterized protein n=1 Tax=Euplotes crassus TaxID=5936 RepID=A0AAD1XE45_EUPCR|nr:unnamed protein product [Moneuplotes crassus]
MSDHDQRHSNLFGEYENADGSPEILEKNDEPNIKANIHSVIENYSKQLNEVLAEKSVLTENHEMLCGAINMLESKVLSLQKNLKESQENSYRNNDTLDKLEVELDNKDSMIEICETWKKRFLHDSNQYAHKIILVLQEKQKRDSRKIQALKEMFETHCESSTIKIKQMREEKIRQKKIEDDRKLCKLNNEIHDVEAKVSRKSEENAILQKEFRKVETQIQKLVREHEIYIESIIFRTTPDLYGTRESSDLDSISTEDLSKDCIICNSKGKGDYLKTKIEGVKSDIKQLEATRINLKQELAEECIKPTSKNWEASTFTAFFDNKRIMFILILLSIGLNFTMIFAM